MAELRQPQEAKEVKLILTANEFQNAAPNWSQWEVEGNRFIPSGKSASALPPGVYSVSYNFSIGKSIFSLSNTRDEDILEFPNSIVGQILDDIDRFWGRRETYLKAGLTHKRGILMHGPPGGGKTSITRAALRRAADKGSVVFKFEDPYFIQQGMRQFRIVQPTTPLIVSMEDIDLILNQSMDAQTAVLNMLDGLEDVGPTVFLGTTNYPEMLQERISNRPGRFDWVVKVGPLTERARLSYLEQMAGKIGYQFTPHVSYWVSETEGMSVAHIRDLFISVAINGETYNSVIAKLKKMGQEKPSSEESGGGLVSVQQRREKAGS